ncbi:MAG: serine protease [Bacillota bacterium]|nr:serine protease [Bacillota bacterium]
MRSVYCNWAPQFLRKGVRREVPADVISLLTTPVVLLNGDEPVSLGTGFYWAVESKLLFLVTNYHVLTGCAPTDNKPHKGDSITIQLHNSGTEPKNAVTIRVPLYTGSGKPVFLTSPSYPEADLAVIPLPPKLCANARVSRVWCLDKEWTQNSLKVRPASEITLVGYPYGFYDSVNMLPIYKTGNVATEPDFDFLGKPVFLVDVSAFPGMSGSPVFAIAYGVYEAEDGSTTVGGARRFLGVYASQQVREENRFLEEIDVGEAPQRLGIRYRESLELGYVWKAKLIVELTEALDVRAYEQEVLGDLPRDI